MSFGDDLRKYAEKQKRNLRDVAFESLLDLSASVIIKTPVADGHLVNNWQPTEGVPASGELNRDDRSKNELVEATKPVISDAIGGVYYLVNNTPYAYDIEFLGRSKQKAPQGMLRVSIENYQQFLDNAIAGLS